jgi:hypothetical protein
MTLRETDSQPRDARCLLLRGTSGRSRGRATGPAPTLAALPRNRHILPPRGSPLSILIRKDQRGRLHDRQPTSQIAPCRICNSLRNSDGRLHAHLRT